MGNSQGRPWLRALCTGVIAVSMFLPVSVASAADAQNPAVDPSTTDLVSAVQDLQKEQEDKEKKDTDKKSDDSQRAANNDDKTATEGTTEQKSEEDKDKAPASEDEKKG